jgi:hypothetical protein
MVDRDVGRPLLEIIHRVSAVTHHDEHQTIGFQQRRRRLIDESRLGAPASAVSGRLGAAGL